MDWTLGFERGHMGSRGHGIIRTSKLTRRIP
jgi:hypothetical protein